MFIKIWCTSGAWRWRRKKSTGGVYLISLQSGKPREESIVYPQLGENVSNPSHCHVLPYEICWMTNKWFYQHGSFVVSCRKTFGNFIAETTPQFLQKFLVEMWGKFPRTCEPYNTQKYDIKHHRHIFIHMTAALAMSLHAILTFRWKWKGSFYVEISTQKILLSFSGISTGK